MTPPLTRATAFEIFVAFDKGGLSADLVDVGMTFVKFQ